LNDFLVQVPVADTSQPVRLVGPAWGGGGRLNPGIGAVNLCEGQGLELQGGGAKRPPCRKEETE